MDEEMKDFLESFGITDPPADPPADPPSDPPPADPPADPPTDPPADPPSDPPSDPPADPPPADKANQAFAAMRVENTSLKSTLQNVAKVLGITETNDVNAMAAAIQQKALEAQAKKDNIPVEVLQKLDRLENLEHQFTATQLQQQAAIGFQKVATDFTLDNKQVVAFAEELLKDGINPYEKPVDLVREYRERHWDQILNSAVEKAVRAEQERAAKAAGQGSDPGTNQGGVPGATDKINTIKDLDSFFSQVK